MGEVEVKKGEREGGGERGGVIRRGEEGGGGTNVLLVDDDLCAGLFTVGTSLCSPDDRWTQ